MSKTVGESGKKELIENTVSGISEGILKLLVGGSVLGIALLAPNIVQVLDKPLARYFKRLDARARERELRNALYYMKRKGWITNEATSYEHGLEITDKGKTRLDEIALKKLTIARPKTWDSKWRLVFFDIPESKRAGRNALTRKLKSLGFYTLQRSVLVHPFPCRAEIEKIAVTYGIESYVSYIETDHIDHHQLLTKKFVHLLK